MTMMRMMMMMMTMMMVMMMFMIIWYDQLHFLRYGSSWLILFTACTPKHYQKTCTVSSLTLRICGTHDDATSAEDERYQTRFASSLKAKAVTEFPVFVGCWWFFRFEKGRKISGWTQKYTSSRKIFFLGKNDRYFRLHIPHWVSIPWCLRTLPPPEWRCVENEGFQSNQC